MYVITLSTFVPFVDIQIFQSFNSSHGFTQIKSVVDSIKSWRTSSFITLNITKTRAFAFSRKMKNCGFVLNLLRKWKLLPILNFTFTITLIVFFLSAFSSYVSFIALLFRFRHVTMYCFNIFQPLGLNYSKNL